MSLAPKARVLSGYRRLFRARKYLFAGDDRAMQESRLAIKAEFMKNKTISTTDHHHFEGLMTMIDEAEDMLRHHIVRGELNQETGNYRTFLMKQLVELLSLFVISFQLSYFSPLFSLHNRGENKAGTHNGLRTDDSCRTHYATNGGKIGTTKDCRGMQKLFQEVVEKGIEI